MTNSEIRKNWDKANMKKISLAYKIEEYENIKNMSIDNDIELSKLFKACYNYCIENNISIDDLKKYI